MIVLGVETSCDETAAAVVCDTPQPHIRANLIRAQLPEHQAYGGVVPEIAARAHLDHIEELIRRALDQAGVGVDQLDGIAAAAGPGLIGGLIVGTMAAKGMAWAAQKPFAAVNHLEAHALTARLSDSVTFPYLLLLVSGGHSQLVVCAGIGKYRVLGASRDDGPAIAEAAHSGDPKRFSLPRPLKGRAGCDFSFSGLKTAVRQTIAECPPRTDQDLADLAAAIELAICDSLVDRTTNAVAWFHRHYPQGSTLVAAGGVAANQRLRAELSALASAADLDFIAPPPELCTDNGAMVAWAGLERLRLGLTDRLDAPVRPRWPLDGSSPIATAA